MALTTEILHNRYERGRLVGSGGMGEVFEGYDRLLTRGVALKVLRSLYAAEPTFLKRFEREAQAAASLAHPNIVGVYDFFVDGGSPVIVMEYVRGQTLRDLLDDEGRLAPDRAIKMVTQICDALTVAHERGIVHRDIKPSNIMVTPEDSVKVMDFGIAQAGGLDKITTPTAVLGTAKYISPEHAARLDVDARSDLYSLGVCLYEMLTGRAPFQDLLPVAIVYCHVNEPPRPPRELNPEIPEALEAVVLRMLAKRPDDRYQSAEDLAEDLERAAHGWPLAAPTVATSTAALQAREDQPAPGGADGAANGVANGAATRLGGAEPGSDPSDPGGRSGPAAANGAASPNGSASAGATTSGRMPRWRRNGKSAGKDDTPAPNGQPAAAAAGAARTRADVWAVQSRPDATGPTPGTRRRLSRQVTLVAAGLMAMILLAAIPFVINWSPVVPREVPAVVGMPLPDALSRLSNAGLGNVDVQPVSDRSRRDLKVVSQQPGPESLVPSDYLITLEVVAPGNEIVVPAVRGKTIAAAIDILEDVGLIVPKAYQWVTDQTIPKNRVVGTKPGAGTHRRTGESILLVVSSGPGPHPGSSSGGQTTTEGSGLTPTTGRPLSSAGSGAQSGGTQPPAVSSTSSPSGTTSAPGPTIAPKPTATGGDESGPTATTLTGGT